MRSRFVRPETRRLELTEGDWLLVKKRLSAGEQHAAMASQLEHDPGGDWHVNPLAVPFARILSYLLDWSFVDESGARVAIFGQPLEVVEAAVRNLDRADFAEVREAIEQHELEMDAERAAEKKTRTGAPPSPAISPSLAAVAGGTNG